MEYQNDVFPLISLCSLDFAVYDEALLYIPLDEDTSVLRGTFTAASISSTTIPGPINNAQCFELSSLSAMGSMDNDCFKDFTGCDSGYTINFWVNFFQNAVTEQEIEVLKFGDFKWSNMYNVTNPKGYIAWKHDSCKLSFPLPIKAWVFVSLYVNSTTLQLYFNGEIYEPVEGCSIPSQLSNTFEISAGGVDKLCMDEISVVPIENPAEIKSFYASMTSGG